MSSAPEGWYVDPSTGKNLRLWDGTRWTDEVAPLPYEATHSGPVDLLAADRVDPYVAAPAGQLEGAEALSGAADTGSPAKSEAETVDAAPDSPTIDPEIERTRLTRRELRARSGTQLVVDDAPKHLPPVTPPAAVSVEEWEATAMPVEIPAAERALDAPHSAEAQDGRRNRILRLSVLLGILAVATSVAVLTAGRI